MSKTPEAELAEAAARVVVSLSERNLKSKNGSHFVSVPRHLVQELHQTIEAIYPGWIDHIFQEKAKAAN